MCDLELGKARVKEALENDYAKWCGRTQYDIDAEKRYKIIFTEGPNYIRVIRTEESDRKSVVGFIVKKATKGFQVGDILKAAGWNAPATNFARGHVEDEELRLNWAGIYCMVNQKVSGY